MGKPAQALSPAALLGLLAAIFWGGGDFSGGMAARRMSAVRVVLISHSLSLAALLLLVWLRHEPLPPMHFLVWGICAGVAGGLGVMCFYTALSLGNMGASAAISGLITAAIPVSFALLTEGLPGWLKLAGFALAAAAIWIIAATPDGKERHHTEKRAAVLAIVSGVCFGILLLLLKLAGAGGALTAMTSARVGSLSATLLTLFLLRGRIPAAPAAAEPGTDALQASGYAQMGVQWALMAALLDTSGNLVYILATQAGRLDVAAMLSSLYPASTILLAAWVLHERPTRRQAFGMALALAAVVLITI
ncbi:MAG: EamA family transporter [Acidobacteriaceae bacterium]